MSNWNSTPFQELLEIVKETIDLVGVDTVVSAALLLLCTVIFEGMLNSRAAGSGFVFKKRARIKHLKKAAVKIEDSDDDGLGLLTRLSDIIAALYPQKGFTVTVKLIQDMRDVDPEERKVATSMYVTRNTNHLVDLGKTIALKNEPIYSNLYHNKNSYYFITDFEEFAKLKYHDPDEGSLDYPDTTIVHPLKRENKLGMNETIGFLCISSPHKFNDVQKNAILMDCIKVTSRRLPRVLPRGNEQ